MRIRHFGHFAATSTATAINAARHDLLLTLIFEYIYIYFSPYIISLIFSILYDCHSLFFIFRFHAVRQRFATSAYYYEEARPRLPPPPICCFSRRYIYDRR